MTKPTKLPPVSLSFLFIFAYSAPTEYRASIPVAIELGENTQQPDKNMALRKTTRVSWLRPPDWQSSPTRLDPEKRLFPGSRCPTSGSSRVPDPCRMQGDRLDGCRAGWASTRLAEMRSWECANTADGSDGECRLGGPDADADAAFFAVAKVLPFIFPSL